MNRHEIKPGDLCIVIAGEDTGVCVTVEDFADPVEVRSELCKASNCALSLAEPGPFVKVDKLMKWKSIQSHVELLVEVPYEAAWRLMPINPKASEHPHVTQRILEHTT